MILQALTGYYEKLAEDEKLERPGWSKAKVSYALEIGLDGTLKRVVPLKVEEELGKKTVWRPQLIRVPEPVTRTAGISANFLCDNSSYILGADSKGKPERSVRCFQAAKEKHMEILKECSGEPAKAVMAFFENWNPENARTCGQLQEDQEELFGGANLIFLYKGRYAQEDAEVQKAWENYLDKSRSAEKALCMVTGETDEIARVHTKILGFPGGQSSGVALVSFNAPAFESYGKEQSFNAPVGNKAMYAYISALGYLLREKNFQKQIGDTLVLYWAESGEEKYQNLFADMMDPPADWQDKLNTFFKNLRENRRIDLDDVDVPLSMSERFYILGLSPNAGRLSVRFFYQDEFGNILDNIRVHYDDMRIARPAWDTMEYAGVWRMLQETVNKKAKDTKPMPHMAAGVLRAILSGAPYPASLYSAVIGRIRAEQDEEITPGRAAIIKAFLIRNDKEEVTVGLNENNTNIAYILGREFALLEAIQEAANPGINATIKDRYFNSACATPAVVFPILFRLKNSHIKKIDSKGLAIRFEKELGDLQAKINVFDGQTMAYPKRLTLEEQGMFILGYYHQTQKRFEKNNKEEQ